MSTFVLLNWFGCLFTSLLLGLILWRQRFLIVKPSLIVILFFHLMVQWATTVDSPRIEPYLPNPWAFALLAQGFPLIGVLISVWTWRHSASVIWGRLRQSKPTSARMLRNAIVLLACYLAVFVPLYLAMMPYNATGLYALLTDPLQAGQARENSLKLIGNPLITYGYAFMASVFAPLIAVLLADALSQNLKRKRLISSLSLTLGIVGVLVVVSLTGARSYAATILLTIVFAALLRRGFPLNPIYLGLAAISVLALPTLISILREGRTVEWDVFWTYLNQAILGRVFYAPMLTGLMHAHYAQVTGYIGVAGIPRLATLFGMEPINVGSLIYQIYVNDGLESGLANTSYVFSYYADFGLIALPVSLIGLWILDAAVWVYRKISDRMLLSCVASVSVASVMFTSAEYTTVLLTGGFTVLLFVAWGVDRLSGIRIRLLPRSLPHPPLQ
jgi:hypothetical protein